MSKSAPPSIEIPERTSSMGDCRTRLEYLDVKRLEHKANSQELKRKLFDASVAKGSEKHVKLQIEELELEQEGHRLAEKELEIGADANLLDPKTYRRALKTTRQRVISLGDQLWQKRRELRACDEASGKIPVLTPDSDNAFAAALLRLYKDPRTSRKRLSTAQSNMKREAVEMYQARATAKDIAAGIARDQSWLRCLLSGFLGESHEVRMAHIVPAMLEFELADYIFGAGAASRLFSADNGLLMHSRLERAFDSGHFVIIPVDPGERPIRRWKSIVTSDAAQNEVHSVGDVQRLHDLDEREICFPTQHRPAARFLYFHMVMTLLRLRQYREPGWETAWTRLVSCRPWPTPGPYLRKSMLVRLASLVGDATEEEVDQLVENFTINPPTGLREPEEAEIGRRVLAIYEKERVEVESDKENQGPESTKKDRKREG